MGMKSLFVQLDNSIVIAFITDHTAKSGILQVLTKNQEFMYYMLIESHNSPPPKKKKERKGHSDSNMDIHYQYSSSVC